MSIEFWNMLGTWMGPLVTAGGFLFVWKQVRRERIALETQTGWQVYQLSLTILGTFVQYPELRPYFYDSKPLPEAEPERSKVLAMVEVVCDHLESIILSRSAIDQNTVTVWRSI